jgi:hypothetical protein
VRQFRFPGTVALAVGAVIFWVTVATAVAVQPLAGLVTTTIYVPDVVTVGFCWLELKLLGPDQEKVTPDVVELADNDIVVFIQVNTPPVALAVGGTISSVTVAVVELVQPVTTSVMVTV